MEGLSEENVLYVDVDGDQSRDELLTYIQANLEAAPIRQLHCDIYVCAEDFGIQHPLIAFIRSTKTLEHVEFKSFGGNASIDAFLDAVSQNHSIHTVRLYHIDCSAYAIQKLMERKIRWKFYYCRFIGHPSSCSESTCNIEELLIRENDPSVIDFMLRFRAWPLLCRLSTIIGKTGMPLDLQVVHLVEHIIPAAPILQDLTMHNFYFEDPAVLQSFSTLVINAPSPDMKWCLTECRFHANTMAVLEKIVKLEKAKSMRIRLTLSKDNYKVLRIIMSESSYVGNVVISVPGSDTMLKILPLLQERPFPSTYYPCTSIRLTIDTDNFERFRKILSALPLTRIILSDSVKSLTAFNIGHLV